MQGYILSFDSSEFSVEGGEGSRGYLLPLSHPMAGVTMPNINGDVSWVLLQEVSINVDISCVAGGFNQR